MAKSNKNDRNSNFAETCSSIISGTITVFLLFLMVIFPLIYRDSYFDILETKYQCYYKSICGMIGIIAVLALVMLVIDKVEFQGSHTLRLLSGLKPKNWKKNFLSGDAAVVIFWLSAVISTMQSDYVKEAVLGNKGRYSGLFLITLYVISYFCISKFWKMRSWILEAFLISGMIVCMIGITDYFQMDVLHFRDRIKPEQAAIFMSTLGNINTYTAYVSLIMGAAVGMYVTAEGSIKAAWYYCCLTVSFFAIVMGCSDNAYLALGAMFAFLPVVLFRSRQGIVRYMIILATFASVLQCISWINRRYANLVIGLDSLFGVLADVRSLLFMTMGAWMVTAAIYFFWYRRKNKNDQPGSVYVRGWIVFLLFAFAGLVFVLYDANIAGNSERYGGVGAYLVFNDQWGTNRGYIWRKSLDVYKDFPVIRKLFGFGPDTFGILAGQEFKTEMVQLTGQTYDAVHNEYIQYLVTVGAMGAISYIAFLVSSCGKMARTWKNNPCVFACMMAVLCYGFQATVNLNLPIATPMMWMLLSIGVAGARR